MSMILVETMYLLAGVMSQDEVVAPAASVTMNDGVTVVKTDRQTILYADAQRVVVTYGHDGEDHDVRRLNAASPPVTSD